MLILIHALFIGIGCLFLAISRMHHQDGDDRWFVCLLLGIGCIGGSVLNMVFTTW